MSTEELEAYVNGQFDELRRLVRLEEKRTLHLVDLKEAFLTASAAEKIAEITVETERLQEEMANITHQLCLLEQVEAQAVGPAVAAEVLVAGPAHRVPVRRTFLPSSLSMLLRLLTQSTLYVSVTAGEKFVMSQNPTVTGIQHAIIYIVWCLF